MYMPKPVSYTPIPTKSLTSKSTAVGPSIERRS